MVQYCCCFGCNEKYVRGGVVTFHSFPKDEARKQVWVQKIRRENFIPTQFSKVCSKHFEEKCFDREKFGGVWLKRDAVPTIFNFPKHFIKQPNRRKSFLKRKSVPLQNPELQTTSFESCGIDNVNEENILTDMFKELNDTLNGLQVLENVRKQICRVCGKREPLMKPIFEMTEDTDCGVTLPVKIEMYLPIKVGANDDLPPNICFKCSDTLQHWHEFHLTCLSADTALRKIFCTREKVTSDFPCETISDTNDREKDDSNRNLEIDDNISLDADHTFSDPESTNNKVSYEEELNVEFEDKPSDLFHNNKPINCLQPLLPSCSYCSEFFYYSDDCTNHIIECQNVSTLCDVCGEQVTQRKQLAEHKRSHVPNKLQSFMCEKCKKYMMSARALQNHLKYVHKEKPPQYYCESCCKVIHTKFYYQLHMKKHDSGKIKNTNFNFVAILKNKNSAVYLCPVCDEVFGDKLTLILHLTTQKLLNCPTCHKDFQNEKKFILHKCRKWYCNDCAESFNNKHCYEAHLHIHKKNITAPEDSI